MKSYFNLSITVLLIFFFSLISCSKSSSDDYSPPSNPEDPNTPSGEITYSNDVKPIISGHCVRCHASPPINGAPMSLTSYNDVKNAVQNRGLLDRIQRQEGEVGAMPKGGPRLPEQSINTIIEWANLDFPQ